MFLDQIVGVKIPPVYRTAFERWKAAVESRCCTAQVAVESRLLVGLGNHSPLEIGFSLHHTYGVPYLPGSALKGVLNHWAAERLSAADKRWTGVTYKSGPVAPPGEWHAALFGQPEIDRDHPGSRGAVEVMDALYVPDSAPGDCPLDVDILTPHQVDYYRSEGTQLPNDWTSPEPHAFLSIRRPARFLLATAGPSDWAVLAMRHLLDALAPMGDEARNHAAGRGIGGKTAAGYGRMTLHGDIQLPAAAHEAALAAARAAYDGEPGKDVRTLIEDKVWNAASINDRVKALLRLIQALASTAEGKAIATYAVERAFDKHGEALRRPPTLTGALAELDREWLAPRRR
jgi:CRISPR-associated protein Cmr6